MTYFVNKAQVIVPLKYFYEIHENCTVYHEKGEKIPKTAVVTESLLKYGSKEEAKSQIPTNIVRELPDKKGYEVTEYVIMDDKGIIEESNPFGYTLITSRGKYSPEDVMKMEKILKHLNFYIRLASIIAYERYGFLRKMTDTQGVSTIYYEDERQYVYFDTDNQIVTEP